MRILVTGSTGFIGYEVTRVAAEAGHEVHALVRRTSRASLLTPFDVQLVVGNLDSEESLRRACTGMDAVVHLAARATFEDYDYLAPSIVEGSRLVARAAVEAGVATLVYGSTLMTYPSVEHGLIGADTPLNPVVDYGRAKRDAEGALAEETAGSSTALGIVRIPHGYGARDLMFGRLHLPAQPLPGLHADSYAHLHVRDCARLLLAAAEQGWVGALPVGDGENASWDTYFAVLREYYPRHRVIRVPAALALPVAAFAEPLLQLTGQPNLITRDVVVSSTLRQPVEPGLLWSELGIEPWFPSVRRGLPAALDEFVSFRWRHPVYDHRRS